MFCNEQLFILSGAGATDSLILAVEGNLCFHLEGHVVSSILEGLLSYFSKNLITKARTLQIMLSCVKNQVLFCRSAYVFVDRC